MASPSTPDFADLIARLAVELEAKRVPFMLIGGQAVSTCVVRGPLAQSAPVVQ
jgi:hypothetical protein